MPVAPGWTYRGPSANAALTVGTVSLTIPIPTGVVANDILIMAFVHKGTAFATLPAGWTPIQRVVSGATRGELHWKRATGSEPTSYAVTGLADTACGTISAYVGGKLSGDIVLQAAGRANVGGTGGAPALDTTGVPGALIIYLAVANVGLGVSSVSAGVGNHEGFWYSDADLATMHRKVAGGTANGTDCGLYYADGLKVVPGSTINDFKSNMSATGLTHHVCLVAALIPETSETPGTRYYATCNYPGPPARQPWAVDGDWPFSFEDTDPTRVHTISTYLLSQVKYGAGRLYAPMFATNKQGNADILCARFMTPPLQAVTLAGNFNMALGVAASWLDHIDGYGPQTTARLKLHMYITVGQTTETRQVLINNYVSATDLSRSAVTWVAVFPSGAVPISGQVHEGDSIVIEWGVRVVSSPTPAPTYPPTEYSRIVLIGRGTGLHATFNHPVPSPPPGMSMVPWWQDAPVGSTTTLPTNDIDGVPFYDFSDTIRELPLPASPANISPMTAKVIPPDVPYHEALYDTRGSSANSRAVWYRWSPARAGKAFVTTFGTLYGAVIDVYEGDGTYAGLILPQDSDYYRSTKRSGMRGISINRFVTVPGKTYYFHIITWTAVGYQGPSSGGPLRINVGFQEAPQEDDLFMAALHMAVYREGELVNVSADLVTPVPSGVTIDYSKKPLTPIDGVSPIHTGDRLVLNMFAGDLLTEIVDIATLNLDVNEIDYIDDGWIITQNANSATRQKNAGALQMSRTGMIYSQTCGNGFLDVCGILAGIPAALSAFSNFPKFSAVLGLDITRADNQAGAGPPWPIASQLQAPPQTTSPWHGTFDETTGILYYASGGLYSPAGTAQTVRRYDLIAGVPLSDFATLPPSGTNPNIRGMCLDPAGGLFVTNGNVVCRLNAAGVVTKTYTALSDGLLTLIDCHLTADQRHLWVLDLDTADLFKFNVATGAQETRVQTGLAIGDTMQFALYQPDGFTPLPTPEAVITERYIRRVRQAPHLADERKRMQHHEFQLDCQVGIGRITGQGQNPTIYLQWSDDRGRTWSNEYPMTIGKLGRYLTRVVWRRLGQTQDRIYRVIVTDPADWALLDSYLKLGAGLD